MKHLRRVFSLRHTAFVIALISSLSAYSALGQAGGGPGNNYYPRTDAPVDNNAALALVETQLHQQFRKVKVTTVGGVTSWNVFVPSIYVPDSTATATVVNLPADDPKNDYTDAGHYILATEVELNIALGDSVNAVLNGTAGSYTGDVEQLVRAAAQYRALKVATFLSAATTNVLNHSFVGGEPDRAIELEKIARGATLANPALADKIVAAMLPLVVPKVKSTLTTATNVAGGTWSHTPSFTTDTVAGDIVKAAIEQAATNTVAIVNGAMGVVIQGVDVTSDPGNPVTGGGNGSARKARNLVKGVVAAAVNAAYANNAGYLADEIAIAIGTKIKGASYLYKPTSLVKQPIVTSSDIIEAIFSAPVHPTDIREIALVAAGAMKGFNGSIFEGSTTSPSTNVSANKPEINIINQINTTLSGSLSGSDQTYLTNVQQGFVAASAAGTTPATVAAAVVATLSSLTPSSTDKDYIAARVTGAGGWLPAAVPLMISGVLNEDARLGGANTVAEIVEAAVRSNAAGAGVTALNATLWGKVPDGALPGTPEANRLGQITKGAALGLKGQPLYNTMFQGVVTKVLAGSPIVKVSQKITTVTIAGVPTALKTPVSLTVLADGVNNTANSKAELTEITKFAIAGAQESGNPTAVASVLYTLAKAASATYQFYQPILDGAIGSTASPGTLSVVDQWRAVLSALAGKTKVGTTLEFDGTYDTVLTVSHPKPTANFQTLLALIPAYAKGSSNFDHSNDTAVDKGAAVISDMQVFPKAIFNKAYTAFAQPAVSGDEKVARAVETGIALVYPTSAGLAAALAIKLTSASTADIQSTAIGLNPAQAASIKMTVATADHVKNVGTADLFDYLDQTLYQNPKLPAEIVTGATVVAPEYAHIIAHAVGFRQPSAVAKMVPLLFNYSHVTTADSTVVAPLGGGPTSGNANNQYDNLVDATSAITAAITAGILEAKTGVISGSSVVTKPTVEITNLKNAITAVVKQALTLTGNTPVTSPWLPGGGEGINNFKISDGTNPDPGNTGHITGTPFSLGKQIGPAGVITGFVSQAIASNAVTIDGGSTGIIGAVLTAATTVVKANLDNVLAVAQAAAQAARSVSSVFNDETSINNAVFAAFASLRLLDPFKPDGITPNPNYVGYQTLSNLGIKPNPYYQFDSKLANAIHFGVLAAVDHIPGAGAAGVINYTQHSVSGAPVTNIFEL